MKAQELTVEVRTTLTVSNEMAERCLRLLEMWQDDHPDAKILADQEPGGKIRFRLVNV